MTAKLKQILLKVNPKINFSINLYTQLSSLELVQLIVLMESAFKISLTPNDVDDHYFASLSAIEDLIESK